MLGTFPNLILISQGIEKTNTNIITKTTICGDQIISFTNVNVESSCCIPKSNIIKNVLKKQKRKKYLRARTHTYTQSLPNQYICYAILHKSIHFNTRREIRKGERGEGEGERQKRRREGGIKGRRKKERTVTFIG